MATVPHFQEELQQLQARLLANMLDVPLYRAGDASHGPALGAARLAQAALTGRMHFPRPLARRIFEPRPDLVRRYDEAHQRWSGLYPLMRRVPGVAASSVDLEPVS